MDTLTIDETIKEVDASFDDLGDFPDNTEEKKAGLDEIELLPMIRNH